MSHSSNLIPWVLELKAGDVLLSSHTIKCIEENQPLQEGEAK
jgi:hypothetical protein